MKPVVGIFIAIVLIVAVSLFSLIGSYNRFVSLSQNVKTQWSQVETQYQRRVDLVPNLVNSVKGIMVQEREVFGQIAQARTKYGSASTQNARVEAATELETALSRLLVVIENYPTLRSSENVSMLMDELAGTENRISVERRRYNEAVKTYNLAVVSFPANILARLFGFSEVPYFEAVSGADKAPNVDLIQ